MFQKKSIEVTAEPPKTTTLITKEDVLFTMDMKVDQIIGGGEYHYTTFSATQKIRFNDIYEMVDDTLNLNINQEHLLDMTKYNKDFIIKITPYNKKTILSIQDPYSELKEVRFMFAIFN